MTPTVLFNGRYRWKALVKSTQKHVIKKATQFFKYKNILLISTHPKQLQPGNVQIEMSTSAKNALKFYNYINKY